MTGAWARPPGVRHVWASMTGGYVYPGLLISWRRVTEGWEGQVAVVMRETVLVRWLPESRIRPVSDDGWQR